MRDANDNNVDDNLENFGILGVFAHLQNQQKAQQQSAKQLEELKRLREATEQAARSAQRARTPEVGLDKSLPQCPFCGGRLEGQFRKCMHCASNLSWVEGQPCEPGKEQELQLLLNEKQRQKQEMSKQQSEMVTLLNGLKRHTCPVCRSLPPGSHLPSEGRVRYHYQELKEWVQTIIDQGCCPKCFSKKGALLQLAESTVLAVDKCDRLKDKERDKSFKAYMLLGIFVIACVVLLIWTWPRN